MDKKWLLIGGGGILLIVFLLFMSKSNSSESLPKSSSGNSSILVPNTQDVNAANSLADAIAKLNAAAHPTNAHSTVPAPVLGPAPINVIKG